MVKSGSYDHERSWPNISSGWNLFEIAGDGGDVADFVGTFATAADFESGQFGDGNQRDLGIQNNTEY